MPTTRLEVITAERVVYSDDVDMVLVPGVEGQLGILPRHAYLLTALTEGELVIRKAGQEDEYIAIGGGFMEVGPDHVTILADSAERAEEIDVARAEAARKRAEALLAEKRDVTALAEAAAALRRSRVRLQVARRRKRGGRGGLENE
ncbi:MAG: F0F1 ATP synthase subunit epsilon [Anaerolineae bacterium]|nr:F0F1 ATP synthase subunit epsilon [Anaerolineae bacterium]